MRWLTTFLAAIVFCCSVLFLSHVSAQSPGSQEVRDALKAQDEWLANQPTAAGWNKYLQSSQLHEQLEKGASADAKVVHEALQKYQAKAAGLNLPLFAATHKALEVWADELSRPTLQELAEKARAAKQKLKPISQQTVREKEVALEGAVHRLDRYLAGASTGKSWQTYLKLPELQAELKKELEANPKTISEIAARFTSGAPGLEFSQFMNVAKAIGPYAEFLAAYQNSKGEPVGGQDLDALASDLESLATKPDSVDRQKLGELLAQISATVDTPDLIAAVRQRLAQPNLLVHASKNIVAGGIDRDLNEPTPVEDNILGTYVTGMGQTVGKLRSVLLPNSEHAVIDLSLSGNTTTKTVGYNGPVTIFSHGTTSIDGHKQIILNKDSFTSLPATAECSVHNCIDDLDICGGWLIQKIATNRVYSSQGQAQAIAGEHAEARVEKRLNNQTAGLLGNVNRTYSDQFRNPLLRKGAFPQQLAFSTTADWLNVVGLQSRANELGATSAPPEVAADAELSVRLHESLIDNMSAVISPGRTIRNMAYRRGMRDLNGEPYQKSEYTDLLLCLAETGAPDQEYGEGGALAKRERDEQLVISQRNFASLMKDRFNIQMTDDEMTKEYTTLTHALYDESIGPNRTHYNSELTSAQFNKYLARLPKDEISLDQTKDLLRHSRVNYSAMTYADANPIEVHFQNNQAKVVLRIQSTTERYLGGDPAKRVVNPYPAEVYVTYNLSVKAGTAVADRVESEYGVKAAPLSPEAESKLSSAETKKRSALLTKILPHMFFGTAADPQDKAEGDEPDAEPIFPASKSSPGLKLHGKWEENLGPLPWTQLTTKDGWLAMGWTIAKPQAQSTTHTAGEPNPEQTADATNPQNAPE